MQYHLDSAAVEPHFKRWLEVITAGEIGHVYFPPLSGTSYRVWQFVDWCKSCRVNIELVDLLSLGDDPTDHLHDLQLSNIPQIFWLRSAFNHVGYDDQIFKIENLLIANKTPGLIFHENYQLPNFTNQLQSTLMVRNVEIFPLPSMQQIDHFCDSLCQEWEISPLSKQEKKLMFAHAGRHLWLVKDILRNYRKQTAHSVAEACETESYKNKTEAIWHSLPAYFQSALIKKVQGSQHFSREEKKAIHNLVNFNLIHDDEIPTFLESMAKKQTIITKISPTSINCNGFDFTSSFSLKQRRLLTALNQEKTKFITRETAAKAYWGDTWEDNYSDWALDQSVSRLRQKIKSVGLGLEIITKRGVGYGLNS